MVEEADDFRDELAVPLRKSFTPEDGNVLMHIHAIRYYFIRGEFEKYNSIQRAAETMNVPTNSKNFPRLPVKNPASTNGLYTGSITKLGAAYGFIRAAGFSDDLYFGPNCCADDDVWDSLREGAAITFRLCFNAKGAIATEVAAN